MKPTSNLPDNSDSQVKSSEVPPEEEELFREFQAYARSIYVAATDGAVQSLTSATVQLRLEVDILNSVVVQSRENYKQLFEPAISEFKASAERTIVSMSQRQEEIAKQQDVRITETLRKLSQEHQITTKQSVDAITTLVKNQAKQLLWILAGIGVVLIAVLVFLILQAVQ